MPDPVQPVQPEQTEQTTAVGPTFIEAFNDILGTSYAEEIEEEVRAAEPSAEPEAPEVPAEPQVEQPTPDPRDARIAALEADIAALRDRQQQQPPQEQPVQQQAVAYQELPFVSEEEYEAAITDPKAFNKVLNKVYATAFNHAAQAVMQNMPQVINNQVTQQQTVQQAAQTFYADNQDLYTVNIADDSARVARAEFISQKANEIQAKNPGIPYHEILSRTEQEVRRILGISKTNSAPARALPSREQAAQRPAPVAAPKTRVASSNQAQPGKKSFAQIYKETLG